MVLGDTLDKFGLVQSPLPHLFANRIILEGSPDRYRKLQRISGETIYFRSFEGRKRV